MMPAHVSLVTAISERRTKKTILLQIFHRNQILLRVSAPPRCNWFSPIFLRVSVPPWWVLGLVVALLRRVSVVGFGCGSPALWGRVVWLWLRFSVSLRNLRQPGLCVLRVLCGKFPFSIS